MENKLSAENFCFWLQGFFELTDVKTLSEKQVNIIKEHLELVFVKGTVVSKEEWDKVLEQLKNPPYIAPTGTLIPYESIFKTPHVTIC